LPRWTAPWIALGLRAADCSYLAVWRRPGADADVELPITHEVNVDVLFPADLPSWSHSWDSGVLSLKATDVPAARIFRLTPTE
jgi:alpha-galactosidase